MAKERRPKARLTAKQRLIVVLIPTTVVLIIAMLLAPLAYFWGTYFFMTTDTGYTPVDTTLTTEQKLADLDYMYDVVCLQNPNKELFEEAYGISYDDIYNRYRDLVIDTETEFQYFSVMSSFLMLLPGAHNGMSMPDYDHAADSFVLTEVYASQEMKDYAYSWKEDFRDDVESYLQYNLIGFAYYDGTYVGRGVESGVLKNVISDYCDCILLSVDGQDPVDLCFDYLQRNKPTYDGCNDCFYRKTLFFNDGIGIEHTLEILMPDGTIETVTVYEDPALEIACADGVSRYPELFDIDTDADEAAAVTDPEDENYVPQTYTIETDSDRKVVYVNSTACSSAEGELLANDLEEAIEEIDAETVIMDFRWNHGGVTSFVNEQVLPVLFSSDLKYTAEVVGGKCDFTKNYYCNPYYLFYIGRPLRTDSENFYYTENFDVEGKATKDLKIYLLTSSSTFSSGDLMTYLCKEYDNATVVGNNSGGEGICGSPFNCYLPESRFMFVYTATMNVEVPEDTYLGIAPDVYIPFTVDEYLTQQELKNQGVDVNTYEVRQQYDQTLQYVLEQIDGAA